MKFLIHFYFSLLGKKNGFVFFCLFFRGKNIDIHTINTPSNSLNWMTQSKLTYNSSLHCSKNKHWIQYNSFAYVSYALRCFGFVKQMIYVKQILFVCFAFVLYSILLYAWNGFNMIIWINYEWMSLVQWIWFN